MRIISVLAALLAAAPATAAEYSVRLAPEARDLRTRLMLFAEGPVGGGGLYGEGTGAFDLPDSVPMEGAATFRRVPVRFQVGGRTFAGLATVTFVNGAFDGLVADTLTAKGTPFGPALTLQGGQYAFGGRGLEVTGRVSAAPGGDAPLTPEPGTWALTIVGMGLIGILARRRAGEPRAG